MQQPLRLVQHELGVHERFVADVLPADEAGAVDQKRAVQWHVLEIVVGPIGAEDGSIGVGDEGKSDRFVSS